MAVPIAKELSRAQPVTVVLPDRTEPGDGASICYGQGHFTSCRYPSTLAVPVSGVASVSVAETVMVCWPAVSVEVFN